MPTTPTRARAAVLLLVALSALPPAGCGRKRADAEATALPADAAPAVGTPAPPPGPPPAPPPGLPPAPGEVAEVLPLPPRPVPSTPEYKLGDRVTVGDLVVCIPEVVSSQFAGQRFGKYTPVNLMMARVTIENTSGGKIVNWPGWQGRGFARDEHGNRFEPANLAGWARLPNNDPPGDGWDGDSGARIFPGKPYENALYFEYAPPTSRLVVLTLPLDGKEVRFSGPIGTKVDLEHKAAVEAKKGRVLDAADLLRDIRRGSATWKTDYPTSCTMKAVGVVREKQDRKAAGSSREGLPYKIVVSCDAPDDERAYNRAVCYTKDKDLLDRVKVGRRVTLRGTLWHAEKRGEPRRGAEASLYDCVEVENPEEAKRQAEEDAKREEQKAAEAEAKKQATEEAKKKAAAQRAEQSAAANVAFARKLVADADTREKGKQRLRDVIRDFPDTKAAREAKELLAELEG